MERGQGTVAWGALCVLLASVACGDKGSSDDDASGGSSGVAGTTAGSSTTGGSAGSGGGAGTASGGSGTGGGAGTASGGAGAGSGGAAGKGAAGASPGGQSGAGGTFAGLHPTIVTMTPSTLPVRNPAFELVLTGSDFVSDHMIAFDTNVFATTFVSSTELRAEIPGVALGVTPRTVRVLASRVGDPALRTNVMMFEITAEE